MVGEFFNSGVGDGIEIDRVPILDLALPEQNLSKKTRVRIYSPPNIRSMCIEALPCIRRCIQSADVPCQPSNAMLSFGAGREVL